MLHSVSLSSFPFTSHTQLQYTVTVQKELRHKNLSVIVTSAPYILIDIIVQYVVSNNTDRCFALKFLWVFYWWDYIYSIYNDFSDKRFGYKNNLKYDQDNTFPTYLDPGHFPPLRTQCETLSETGLALWEHSVVKILIKHEMHYLRGCAVITLARIEFCYKR